jgi:hypothetical protein
MAYDTPVPPATAATIETLTAADAPIALIASLIRFVNAMIALLINSLNLHFIDAAGLMHCRSVGLINYNGLPHPHHCSIGEEALRCNSGYACKLLAAPA